MVFRSRGSPLSQRDLLDCYLPDNSYDSISIEESSTYPEVLTWMYNELPTGGIVDELYNYDGSGPHLKCNADNSF